MTPAAHPATIHQFVSQPPYPYQPPQFPPDFSQYQPALDPLASARRAGVMLMVMAGLTLLFGGCAGLFGLLVPMDQVLAQSHIDASQFPPGMAPAEFMKLACIVGAVLCISVGSVMFVAGLFVRRGASLGNHPGHCAVWRGAGVPRAQYAGRCRPGDERANARQRVLRATRPRHPAVLSLFWLIQCFRQLPDVYLAQQQYQMQMWQHHQQQAAAHQIPTPPPASTTLAARVRNDAATAAAGDVGVLTMPRLAGFSRGELGIAN